MAFVVKDSIVFIAWCAALGVVACGSSPSDYALVADAGSTGTRVYLFQLKAAGADVDVTDLGKGPALSGFADKPAQARETVEAQVAKAKDLIPAEHHASVPLAVYATAGMRLVEEDIAAQIYSGLREGLLNDDYPFNRDTFQARTISGREEGIFALLAANYLAGKISSNLELHEDQHLLGVLDLGGSSTQIAVPPKDVLQGGSILPHLGHNQTYVQSFLSLGMEKMRQRTYAQFSAAQSTEGPADNPCAFPGLDAEESEPHSWKGIGRASACEATVREVLQKERSSCQLANQAFESSCLPGDPVQPPRAAAGAPSFYLISGYLYVLDFARWWLTKKAIIQGVEPPTRAAFSRPQVEQLREAARWLCAAPWEEIIAHATASEGAHKFTGKKKVPHRCFELNYVIALLTEAYGFDSSLQDLFEVVEEVNGNEIEWTLGAFLFNHAKSTPSSSSPGMEL